MRPFSARFYPDIVVVDPAGAARRVACSVQVASDAFGTTRVLDHEAVESITAYTLLFAGDPGVAAGDVRIDWTANASGAFSRTLHLTSKGPARPPGGLKSRWTLDAQEVA